MTIVPILDRILVKPIEESDISKGGIHMVQFDKQKPFFGEVIAVGPGRRDDHGILTPLCVYPGDVVCYKGDYVGVPLENEGQKYLMMKEQDILGVRE